MTKLSRPTNESRIAVIGRTGSGKTVFGIWLLGEQLKGPWAHMPVTIFDYKHDKLIAKLGAKPIRITDKPPTKPGLYLVQPNPDSDNEAATQYLMRVWAQEEHGIFIDEGYMFGQHNRGFRSLLTQGRSKRVPMIYLSQRPVRMDLFAFSEADYFAVFNLNDKKDRIRVNEYTDLPVNYKLAKHCARWYDVSEDQAVTFSPCPPTGVIVNSFRELYGPKSRGSH
jgi:hypothetical protein